MTVCTYDNPATMQRECWSDGRLLCAYSFAVLEPLAKHLIPSQLYFFGANVGPWEEGQVVGDFAAVSVRNHEEILKQAKLDEAYNHYE